MSERLQFAQFLQHCNVKKVLKRSLFKLRFILILEQSIDKFCCRSEIILITILTQDKIIVKMVITPETLLTN